MVYELSQGEHRCTWDPDYPEHPGRLLSVLARCDHDHDHVFVDDGDDEDHVFVVVDDDDFFFGRCDDLGLLGRCKRIPARQATKDEVGLLILFKTFTTKYGDDKVLKVILNTFPVVIF